MRRLLPILLGLCAACDGDNQCVTDFACAPDGVCVANTCVGVEVKGDPVALYAAEFRLRLEKDCVVCHADGLRDASVALGDNFWRFYSGVTLPDAQVATNLAEVREFLGRGDARDSPLITYARGLAGHPVIYGDLTDLGYRRVINWLSLFPKPEAPPVDPDVPDPGAPGYVAIVHDTLTAGCSCHVDDLRRAWAIAPADADEAARAESYTQTRAWFTPGDPEASQLIRYGRGELGHPGAFWAAGDAAYDQVFDWITRTVE